MCGFNAPPLLPFDSGSAFSPVSNPTKEFTYKAVFHCLPTCDCYCSINDDSTIMSVQVL